MFGCHAEILLLFRAPKQIGEETGVYRLCALWQVSGLLCVLKCINCIGGRQISPADVQLNRNLRPPKASVPEEV